MSDGNQYVAIEFAKKEIENLAKTIREEFDVLPEHAMAIILHGTADLIEDEHRRPHIAIDLRAMTRSLAG